MATDDKVLSHLGLRSKVLPGPITDLSIWVDICTSNPHQGVKYQLWYLEFFWGDPINIPWKLATDGKVLSQLGLRSNILSRPLTDSSGFWGYCTSSLQQGVKYQLDIWIVIGGTVYISHEKLATDGKVLSHFEIRWKVLPGPLTDLCACVGICTSSPPPGVKYQVWYLDFI